MRTLRFLLGVVLVVGTLLTHAQQTHFSATNDPGTLPDAPSAVAEAVGRNGDPGLFGAGTRRDRDRGEGTDDTRRGESEISEPPADIVSMPAESRSLPLAFLVEPVVAAPPRDRFQMADAVNQAFVLLSAQHALRLVQPKTRRELGGPFFGDYVRSLRGIQGWRDGDGPWTNYILHPGEGGIASFIFIQNSPKARKLEFQARSGEYWRSRLKAMAFAAAYSTQFEIGLYSEATIGNVGMKPGTNGYVDFVMTPVGGFAFTVTEDAVDKHVIQKLERNRSSLARKRLYRVILNPERAIANLLRFKYPWYRDHRPMPPE